MSALVDDAVVGVVVTPNVVEGDCSGGQVGAYGAAAGSGARRAPDATGPTRAVVMQSTPVESGIRQLVFVTASARHAQAGELGRDSSGAVDRRGARRRSTQLGPEARPVQLRTPGGRPAQPTPPLVAPTVWVARSSVTTLAAARVPGRSHSDDWELSPRGLVVMMVGFLLAVLCGLVVAVSAFLSISAAPMPPQAAGAAAAVVRAAV